MLPSELTNAVGLRLPVEGEAEADVQLDAVVVGQRQPRAEAVRKAPSIRLTS